MVREVNLGKLGAERVNKLQSPALVEQLVCFIFIFYFLFFVCFFRGGGQRFGSLFFNRSHAGLSMHCRSHKILVLATCFSRE